MNQIDTREGAFRRHRVIGLFAVIQCWIKGIDGVVFQRYQLERLSGMQRFKTQRRVWLKADLKEYFEYREHLVLPKRYDSLYSLFVSRFPLKPFPSGKMSDEERIERIASQGDQSSPSSKSGPNLRSTNSISYWKVQFLCWLIIGTTMKGSYRPT